MKKKKDNTVPAAADGQTSAASKTKSPLSLQARLAIIIIASLLGVAIIITGIILPFALNDTFTDDESVRPYAVIKLSNGMQLDFELWEDDCPNGVTNFIYLASIGYFDGAAIFDSQNGWVRFGGWLPSGIHRGDSDTAFLAKITDRTWTASDGTVTDRSENKFGYRLKNDTKNSNRRGEMGVLSFCYERSATEFQVVADENTSLTISGDDGGPWNCAPIGIAASETTRNNLAAIYALDRDDGTVFAHDYYRAPLDENGMICIKSVKVTRKFSGKWRNFDFMDFMYGANGSSHLSSWYRTVKKTGAK